MFKRLGDFIELALTDSDVTVRLICLFIVASAALGVLVEFDPAKVKVLFDSLSSLF